MTVEPTTKDKQVTVDVPEDRVAEFYALYGHFLAGSHGRRRGHRGPPGHRGHRCGSHHHGAPAEQEQQPAGAGPEATTV